MRLHHAILANFPLVLKSPLVLKPSLFCDSPRTMGRGTVRKPVERLHFSIA